jgi:hypothetical protein
MHMRILIEALAFALLAVLCATVGPAIAQALAQPTNAGPMQPWGLPPLPPGVGPVEKFTDISSTPQGKFLEGGSFDEQGNLWFVGIGSGWISYLQPNGKLVPVINCNPPPEIGQTCEPQGTRWKEGSLYLTTRHRGILVYDPQTKELKTLVYTCDMAELLDEVAEILFISAGADIGPNTWASSETFRLSHTSSSAYAVLKIVGVRRGDRLP